MALSAGKRCVIIQGGLQGAMLLVLMCQIRFCNRSIGGVRMSTELDNQEIPRYLRVYNYYKELILSGKLSPETKLPSIRKGAIQLQISRTTMESAYLLLAAEGYIISRPQSGYYVTDIANQQKKNSNMEPVRKRQGEQKVQYDFVTSNVDRESFRFELWRRYMKSALRQDTRLLTYGEPQGERDFREVLCNYLHTVRGVICSPEQIVIGAGVQSLLHILCPMIIERKKAAFYNSDFVQGCSIFEDFGFTLAGDYHEEGCSVYYLSPSQMTRWGGVMPVAERLALIGEALERDCLIIEDDYNSEFRYFQRPAPSLQGLAGGRGVVYLGTFSKMLLPSIRISYMVLPPELLEQYEVRKNRYNQTASKAEQIALTQFIRDGHLAGQIRKSRKIHMAKAGQLADAAEKVLGKRADVKIGDSGLHVYLDLDTDCFSEEIAENAKKKGLVITPVPASIKPGKCRIMMNCGGVEAEKYHAALEILLQCF